jgi:alkanesulfonate monooxygenase SsuD/methylene tetrahydromethanopterin reductase-like flavin-dependent oxidoreductase (luciferase family)
MKISLFYEMQIADAGNGSEAALFRGCVEQAKLADDLGFHCVWAVEHHGLYEYAHSSAPEIFLSFVAAQTRKIRVGHGVTLTPHRFNHPIRIAERVATLDILSEGRVNWGSGKSSSNVEAELFGIEQEDLEPQWEEALSMVPTIWSNDVFSWDGKHYKVPPTHIVPKPVQKPHPPIFGPAYREESLMRLGRLGIGALNFSLPKFDDLQARIRGYKAAVRDAAPRAWAKNDTFGVTVNTCVLDDDLAACEHGFRGAKFFRDSFAVYYSEGQRPAPGPIPVPRDKFSRPAVEMLRKMRNGEDTQLLSIIGDPVIAREKVARFKEAGVDELLLIMQLGTIPQDVIMKSLRCFGEKVMPYVN